MDLYNKIAIRLLNSTDIYKLYKYYQNLSDASKNNFQPHSFNTSSLEEICKNSDRNYIRLVAENGVNENLLAYAIIKVGHINHDVHRLATYRLKLNEETDFTLTLSVAEFKADTKLHKQLIERVFDEIKKRGGNRVFLWGGVRESNLVFLKLYQEFGFRILGQFENAGKNYDMVKDFNDLLYNDPTWLNDLIIYEINPYAFNIPKGEKYGNFTSVTNKLDYLKDLGINGIWLAGYCEATQHFRGIPTVYAAFRPDKIDSRLGTDKEFKHLVEQAHKRGIKIFLDVITHGVTNDSPLLQEHPDWFSGTSWGMTDFIYENPEFRKWFIATYVNYTLEYNIDGYRLDGPNGVQNGYEVLQIWDEIIAICSKHEKSLLVFPENHPYHFQQGLDETLNPHEIIGKNPARENLPVPRFKSRSISNHDHGIDQIADRTYYQLRGSRYKLAYEYIFSYNIPIIMSGEEFNADYIPLPDAEKELFGGDGSGTSVWLYASWLHWEQIVDKEKRDFLNDFKKILLIKHENSDLLHYDRLKTQIAEIPFECNIIDFPVPYMRYQTNKAILVIGNNSQMLAQVNLQIPYHLLNDQNTVHDCIVTDLWSGVSHTVSLNSLNNLTVDVLPDFTKGGGIRVISIQLIAH